MNISTEDLKGKAEDLRKNAVKLCKRVKWAVLDIVDVAMKNKKVTLPIMGIVLVAIVTIIVLISKTDAASGDSTSQLEKNAYPEINELMAEYFAARAEGDVETVSKLKSFVDDSEKLSIQAFGKYVESYENLACYTKKGIVDDTFIVCTYYEVKLFDVDTVAPSIQAFYVCKNEEGNYYIYSGEIDEHIDSALTELMEQEDIVELFNQVSVKYQEAIDSDPVLKDIMENQILTSIRTEMGETIAAAEIADAEAEGDATTSGNDSVSGNEAAVSGNDTEETPIEETPAEEAPAADVIQYVRATTVVNVRSSDSETADKLGKLQTGDTYRLYENRLNGWSKIDYNGKEAYVKTEYLEVSDEKAVGEAPETEETQTETTTTEPLDTSDKYVMAKETVNVRKSASQTAEKLGAVYPGEKLELIMQQADGWCKVKYKGQTGYVKTEYVE